MKTKILVIFTVLLIGGTISAEAQQIWPPNTWLHCKSGSPCVIEEHLPETQKVRLSSRQKIWMDALAWCESNGDPDIINPKDSDGTPSYGMFSFKPATYAMYAKKIKLASTTDFMNEVGQRKIVEFMILDPNTNLRKQFPGCTRKLGLPPKSDIL